MIQKRYANWIDETNAVTKKHKNTKHSSTKLTATEISLEKVEKFCLEKIPGKEGK